MIENNKSSIEMMEKSLKANLEMVQNIKLGNFSKEEQSITIYLVCDGLSKMSKDIMDMYKFGES
tara:strand:- start:41 stop:232 length:192 start_codon:yes stop_codon:yes gene_type:complete